MSSTLHTLLTLLLLTAPALCSFATNLAYRSPSHNHPSLGISIHKVNKRHNGAAPYSASVLNFTHGVASGDPYHDSVILWTRCSPMAEDVRSNSTVQGAVPLYNPVPIYGETTKRPSSAPVCLVYRVGRTEGLEEAVQQGIVYTSSDVDYTVKVEAEGLDPFTQYYYQFVVCNSNVKSPVGRTKTAPRPTDDTTNLNLAVYSCSNYPFGFFNAFGNPARKDSVDYVIHLGDYIYESAGNGDYGYGQAINRVPKPERVITTLYDYRTRYATYRTDLDLLLSHQTFPWIPVWDDHEVADNTYRDGSAELNNTENSFVKDGGVSVDQRKMNAVRAYFEWMPIRQVDMDDNLRIWRNFQLGKLVDLIMLDTRQYDRSITDLYWNTDYIHQISNDAGRSMMGPRQENWFYNKLIGSKERGAKWRIIGSQTVMSRLNESISYGNVNPLDYDAWDGYQANRNRTFQTLSDHDIGNNIVIAGDSHANWVSDLVWLGDHAYDPATGRGSVGVEFAGTAVTSPCPFGENITLHQAQNISTHLTNDNRELQWSEVFYRGYFEVYVCKEKVESQFFGMPDLKTRNGWEISLANFTVRDGENRISRVGDVEAGESRGVVENGVSKFGEVRRTNVTLDTESGRWFVFGEGGEEGNKGGEKEKGVGKGVEKEKEHRVEVDTVYALVGRG